jgi:hypothetical protein
MAGFKITNLDQLIAKIPQHATPLPPSAERPIEHYQRGASDARSLLLYFERNVRRTKVHPAKFERHATTLRNMVLIGLVESFERYVKEVAALCVDHIAPLVLDDRLSVFRMNMRGIAAQFSEGSLGKAICESATWLDTTEINDRFGKLLTDPFGKVTFQFFPQGKPTEAWRKTTMDTLFQLRHTIVHNVSVITRSDAARLRLLTKSGIEAPRVLSPSSADVWYVKVFIDETTAWANRRVAERLSELLTVIHAGDPGVFDPATKALEVAQQMGVTVVVAGHQANPT